jgi:hypothetical protein
MKMKRILFFVLVALLGALLLGSVLRISAAAGAVQAPAPARSWRIETVDAEEISVPAAPANAAVDGQAGDLCRLADVQSGSTMTFTAQYDAWIDEATPSTNYGGSTEMYVRLTASGDEQRILVGFDLSALPDDIVVVSATLEMYNMINLARAAGPERADYLIWTEAINASWGEMLVTWNNRPPTTPEGDPPSAFQVSNWTRWDVTNIAQGWVSGLLENYGIMLRGDGSTVGVAYFQSSDYTNPPRLVITYAPAPCEPLTGVSISGPTLGVTDTSYVFNANTQPADAGAPITYTWQATEQTGTYDQSSAAFSWSTPGAKTITVTAENCDAVVVAATHVVTISTLAPGCDAALTGLSVDGPTQGITGTVYTFTVAASPSSATPPFTYTWRATGQSDVVQTGAFTQTSTPFSWNDLGTKFITVTARNCGGEIVAFHPFDVMRPSQLPDLTITHAWYESGPDRVGYLIKNVGGSAAPAGHVTELYQAGSPVGQVVFDQSLPAGALRADYITYTWGCAGTTASVLLEADSGDAVGEGEEHNNRWSDTWGCDLVPPQIIAGPTVLTTTEHTVVIAWQTDEPCSERVDYNKNYYTPVSQSDSTYRTDHQFTLTGLDNGTTYYYQVFATDQGGNGCDQVTHHIPAAPDRDPCFPSLVQEGYDGNHPA